VGFRGVTLGSAKDIHLKTRVSSLAEDIKATRAMLRLGEYATSLEASAIHIASGGQARQKLIQIVGKPAQIKKRPKLFCGDLS